MKKSLGILGRGAGCGVGYVHRADRTPSTLIRLFPGGSMRLHPGYVAGEPFRVFSGWPLCCSPNMDPKNGLVEENIVLWVLSHLPKVHLTTHYLFSKIEIVLNLDG